MLRSAAVPDPVELALIVTSASTVPEVIRECGERGIKAAINISAGFKEAGVHGAALESEVLFEARRWGMRLILPTCLGVMNPITGFNATLAQRIARPGTVGFRSQSGAMCSAVLDWSLREQVGFSACVSTGQAAKAAASHTGSLAGSDEVLDAAFRRCGVLRVDHISEICDMLKSPGASARSDRVPVCRAT